MHTIYRIVNFRNGKMYVGQTIDHKKRKVDHWNKLRRGTHHSLALQGAYDKWGESAFYLEIIEDGITDDDIDEREIYWIEKFDSLKHGYNRSPGGKDKGCCITKTCVWNGVQYPSIREAAKTIGISEPGMRHRIVNGYNCDADLRHGGLTKVTCIWNGIEYESIYKAGDALGINQATMWERIQKGYTCDSDLKTNSKPCKCMWNNIEYKTMGQAAKANRVCRQTMANRLAKGHTCDADLR